MPVRGFKGCILRCKMLAERNVEGGILLKMDVESVYILFAEAKIVKGIY